MKKERKAIRVENGLIILAIAALWPAILRWPERITRPVLYLVLVALLVILRRRLRRLFSPRPTKNL